MFITGFIFIYLIVLIAILPLALTGFNPRPSGERITYIPEMEMYIRISSEPGFGSYAMSFSRDPDHFDLNKVIFYSRTREMWDDHVYYVKPNQLYFVDGAHMDIVYNNSDIVMKESCYEETDSICGWDIINDVPDYYLEWTDSVPFKEYSVILDVNGTAMDYVKTIKLGENSWERKRSDGSPCL